MPEAWDPACEAIFMGAKRQAEALHHPWMGTEHVALSMLSIPQSLLSSKLRGLEQQPGDLADLIIADFEDVKWEDTGSWPLTPRMKQVVAMADDMAAQQKLEAIGEHQLLHALIEAGPGVFIRALLRWGVEPGALWRATAVGTSTPTVASLHSTVVDGESDAAPAAARRAATVQHPTQATTPVKPQASPSGQPQASKQAVPKASLRLPAGAPMAPVPLSHNPALLDFGVVSRPRAVSPTPHVDRLGRDVTTQARSGHFVHLVPRPELLAELELDLCRETRGATLLVGSSGCGKTALVEMLALHVMRPDVPRELLGVRVIEVPALEMLSSGFDKALHELEGHRAVLLLDELHRPLKQGRARGYQAVKQVLDMPGLLLLATCTPDAWHDWLANEASLKRRLHVVEVPPTSEAETKAILAARIPEWGHQHGVEVRAEALDVVWAAHALPQCGTMPDLALNLLEEACLRARAQHVPVDADLMTTVVQRRTGQTR